MHDSKGSTMNTSNPLVGRTTRIVSLALATVITVSMLLSVDMLATRDGGESVIARASQQVQSIASAMRGAGKRG
jgi:hypothetical protein